MLFLKKILPKKKYQVRYYNLMKNPPFNDAYFCLGKPNTLGDKEYEYERIWIKQDKLEQLLAKPYFYKEDILSKCWFPKQKNYLNKCLR